jgi:hypothetical protein
MNYFFVGGQNGTGVSSKMDFNRAEKMELIPDKQTKLDKTR